MLRLKRIFDYGLQPAPPFERQVNDFLAESHLSREDIVNITYDFAPIEDDYRAVYIIYEDGERGYP